MPDFMLARLVALCFATLAASPAPAQDDCTVGPEAIKPTVDLRSPSIERTIASRFVDAEKRRFEQIFNLKGGITTSVDVMGCHHFAMTFTFRPIRGLAPATHPKELIRIARELFETIPFNPDGDQRVQSIKDALRRPNLVQEAESLPQGISFSCGEIESCEIAVPKPRILEISYILNL